MNKKTNKSQRSTGTNKGKNHRTLYIHAFLSLMALNLILIALLLTKLNTMNSHIDKLNTMINEEVSLTDPSDILPDNTVFTNTVESEEPTTEYIIEADSSSVVTLSDETIASDSYAAKCLLDYVDAPVERSESNVLQKLSELSKDNDDILDIYNNSSLYPAKMLENLANNPEMANFVKNYKGSALKASGGFTESEKSEKYPLLLQWDERWGYVSYGDDSVIGLAGCGPTCLSMILFSLTRDESLTPDILGAYAMENGYYMFGTGTMWALFEEVPPIYGVTSENLDKKDSELIFQALKDGKMLVFSVGPGDFTAYGHFIVVYGIDEEGKLLVNDPNCVYRSTQHWDYQKIKNQIKSVWSFEYNNYEIY